MRPFCCLIILLFQASLASTQKWNTYTAPDQKMLFNYPETWGKEEGRNGAIIQFSNNHLLADRKATVWVSFFANSVKDTAGYIQYLEYETDKLVKEQLNSRINFLEKRTINNLNGVYLDYTQTSDKKGKERYHTVSWTVLHGSMQYTLRYFAESALDQIFLQNGLDMIQSFRLLPSANIYSTQFDGFWKGTANLQASAAIDTIFLEVKSREKDALVIAYAIRNGHRTIDTLQGIYDKTSLLVPYSTPSKTKGAAKCKGHLYLHGLGKERIGGIFGSNATECLASEYIASRTTGDFRVAFAQALKQQGSTGVAKSVQATAMNARSGEYQLLFQKVNTNLSEADKQSIYRQLQFKSAGNGNFILPEMDEKGEYPFTAELETIDLNGDQTEEILVNWGNTYTAGRAGGNVTLFIKGISGYQPNLGFGGSISDLVAGTHQGFPDLVISAPGMEIPVWRFNGYKYEHYKSVSNEAFKKLKLVSLESFRKNPALVLQGKNTNTANATESKPNAGTKPLAPKPQTKKLIYRRWTTIDLLGPGHDDFMQQKSTKGTGEMEFGKDGQLYLYTKGVLQRVMRFVIASDGNSILLYQANGRSDGALQVISISSNELRFTSDQMLRGGTLILRPSSR